ncbi:LysR family transcriptional regulator [Dictyobacter aurantiacus]|uniref:LysR family transcriptional regulator n=1 Tax=Dictyobacter aurantiacus TaxID=1936993 RepID=A0A401ZFK4_9CHLR|nr:LysR family transcriptional regulator [Dictyobacter aurantiacus]GCE05670.1 LysR family transcriptional regulator [Dictyobacter aurantiacus]
MELRHLYYFVAVAEELHFGRAAERLRIAQPPLSQQIQSLEQELGVQLFYRTKRQVQLTEAGELFLPEARLTLAQAEQAMQTARKAGRGEVGRLMLGFVGSATSELLPELIRQFRRQFPEVELQLRELTTAQQVRALHDGRIQLGILRPPIPGEGLSLRILAQETLIVALSDTHPLAALERIEVFALAQENFIMFPRQQGPGLYDQIISLCRQAGFSPKIVQEAIQMQTITSLVAAELGIAIVPSSARLLRQHGLSYRPLHPQAQATELAMAWSKDDQSPLLRNFVHLASRLYHVGEKADSLTGPDQPML